MEIFFSMSYEFSFHSFNNFYFQIFHLENFQTNKTTMEFDPSKYSTTSFDSMGPALQLVKMIQKQNVNINQ